MANKRQTKGYSQFNYSKENKIEAINLIDLNVTEIIYLGTLLSASQIEYFPFISFNSNEEQPVAPNHEFIIDMVYTLTRNKTLLIPNPLGTFSALEYINKLIDVTKMTFYANIMFMNKDEIIENLLHPEIDQKENCQQLMNMWKKINIEESKAYLNYSLKYVDLPNTVNDRANIVFEKYVEYFTISQIIGLINRCLGYTTIKYQAGKITKNNTGPYLLGAFINQADKAIEKDWNLYKYARPKDLPESFLTSFFFKRVLKLKNRYYDIIPSISELV